MTIELVLGICCVLVNVVIFITQDIEEIQRKKAEEN